MKHILIANPAAGHVNSVPMLFEEANRLSAKYDVEIHKTTGKGNATAFVRDYIAAHPNERVRFYACGGDGTLNEVVNATAYAPECVSISVYPCGSGNDFVKYYGGKEAFLSLEALFEGEEREIDLITDGKEYSVNVANFGFDYSVCKTMEKMRRRPLFGGKRAYFAGVAASLFTAMKNRARVVADGMLLNEKETFLLCTVACGTYVGSSYMCAPRSCNEDGLLEICLVTPVSLPKFLSLMGPYSRGEHLDDKRFQRVVRYVRAKSITVTSPEKGFGYALDGEMHPSDSFTLTVAPRALRFAIPQAAVEIAEKRVANHGILKEEKQPAVLN